LKIDSSINLKRSEKQKLGEQFTGEIDSSGYAWLELSDTEKQRLMDLYKTPSVYRHGLDVSKRVGKLIFFEDERLYPNCPVLILYLSQYKAEILKKLEEYNELTPTRPNKWVTLRRSANITLPDRSKRILYDYYLDKPKIFYNYRVGNNNIFGFTNNHMVAATDMYFFHKFGEKINTYYMLAYLNSKIMTFYFKERPIELQRQKSNVENDIPIFLPRNDREQLLQRVIIAYERKLTRKLQRLERFFRLKGFHFDLNISNEDETEIDLETFVSEVDLLTVEDLSYRVSGDLEAYTIDRDSFPILILNQHNLKKLGRFKEIVFGNDVHFKYKSLTIIVHQKYYDKFKITIDSYFNFAEQFDIRKFVKIKIPTDDIRDIIHIKKNQLFKKISGLSSEEKLRIEKIIDNILQDKTPFGIRGISTVSKILYFIDLSFIKMMAPEYKDVILMY